MVWLFLGYVTALGIVEVRDPSWVYYYPRTKSYSNCTLVYLAHLMI